MVPFRHVREYLQIETVFCRLFIETNGKDGHELEPEKVGPTF